MNWMWRFSLKLFSMGRGFRLLARLFEMLQQILCSNAIISKCNIGKDTVFFHHGLGCVVHYNASIGSNCKIFSNVVIGDKWSGNQRSGIAPQIGNNVLIGTGAVILGNITLGDNCTVGANSVVTKDVPAGSLVVGTNIIKEQPKKE